MLRLGQLRDGHATLARSLSQLTMPSEPALSVRCQNNLNLGHKRKTMPSSRFGISGLALGACSSIGGGYGYVPTPARAMSRCSKLRRLARVKVPVHRVISTRARPPNSRPSISHLVTKPPVYSRCISAARDPAPTCHANPCGGSYCSFAARLFRSYIFGRLFWGNGIQRHYSRRLFSPTLRVAAR